MRVQVHSGPFLLKRSFKRGEITLFTPQSEKAIVACPAIAGQPVLVGKLAWRKHAPGGRIPRRPRLFPRKKERGGPLCQVHWFLPWFRASRRSGEPLFRRINARNVSIFLRKAPSQIAAPAAGRCSSSGFRWGDSRYLKAAGPQWPIVAAAGQWSGLSFRNYVGLSDELSRDMAQLFPQSYSFDSEGGLAADPPVRRWDLANRVFLKMPTDPSVVTSEILWVVPDFQWNSELK